MRDMRHTGAFFAPISCILGHNCIYVINKKIVYIYIALFWVLKVLYIEGGGGGGYISSPPPVAASTLMKRRQPYCTSGGEETVMKANRCLGDD